MRALTIRQPWAEAIGRGLKHIETRSWAAGATWDGKRMRGGGAALPMRLAIHASASMTRRERDFADMHCLSDLTVGAVVATATLVECRRMDNALIDALDEEELRWGLYECGRWAWMLSDVQRLAIPVPARGRLGLWEIEL